MVSLVQKGFIREIKYDCNEAYNDAIERSRKLILRCYNMIASQQELSIGILWETHSQDMEVMNDVRLILTTLSNPSLNVLLVQEKPSRSLSNRIETSETSVANENVWESRNSLSLLSCSCFQ